MLIRLADIPDALDPDIGAEVLQLLFEKPEPRHLEIRKSS